MRTPWVPFHTLGQVGQNLRALAETGAGWEGEGGAHFPPLLSLYKQALISLFAKLLISL